jgi:hypothetical protein
MVAKGVAMASRTELAWATSVGMPSGNGARYYPNYFPRNFGYFFV